MKRQITIATRSSKLALWQANWVKDRLETLHPHLTVDLLHLKTKGDKVLDTPLAKIGGKGLFVKELETAIMEGQADIAVHSMKDVPTELPENLEISVITKRENPSDAFVSARYNRFSDLPRNALVGTSSLRRIAQLQYARPDLRFKSLRGNVDTRLKKLDAGEYAAIILAAAGLIRLQLQQRISQMIPFDIAIPAIGQGAVAIESRVGDSDTLELITPLHDRETGICVSAERAFLTRLNGGCQVPLAGHAILEKDRLRMIAMIANPDGSNFLRMEETAGAEAAEAVGLGLAEKLIEKGGGEILKNLGIEIR